MPAGLARRGLRYGLFLSSVSIETNGGQRPCLFRIRNSAFHGTGSLLHFRCGI